MSDAARPSPLAVPVFVVAVLGPESAEKAALVDALLEFPMATDVDLTRFSVVSLADAGAAGASEAAARVWFADAAPDPGARVAWPSADNTFVALNTAADAHAARAAWGEVAGADRIFDVKDAAGEAELRAALVAVALARLDLSVADARRAKRPYAIAIIASATVVAATEGLLPGAAAFVVATQAGAITSLSFLYTGRWMGRSQALSLIPMFASRAAGGSLFLFAKSFFPPTGVGDIAAAAVAAGLTLSMLGAVAATLDHGYSLDEKDKLKESFQRLRARTLRDKAEILKNRDRWRDKSFWTTLAQKLIFEN